jgi:hypothetical protein
MVFGWDGVASALETNTFAIDSTVVFARVKGRTLTVPAREIRAKDEDDLIAQLLLPFFEVTDFPA